MQDYRKLAVWERSHELALEIYRRTSGFPKEEMYGLTSQMRRSASSIPANIAEGTGRGTNAELAHFLQISIGSASELEYHLLLARDLGFLTGPQHDLLADSVVQVRKMLIALRGRVRSGSAAPPLPTQNSKLTTQNP